MKRFGVAKWAWSNGAFLVALMTVQISLIGAEEEEKAQIPYGFEGKMYEHGKARHAIYYNDGVTKEILEKLGNHLEFIGYFVPEYGGIVQIYAVGEGFTVYLTYRKEYWSYDPFIEEMKLVGEDLEELVIERPISIILVDEDEEGVSRHIVR